MTRSTHHGASGAHTREASSIAAAGNVGDPGSASVGDPGTAVITGLTELTGAVSVRLV